MFYILSGLLQYLIKYFICDENQKTDLIKSCKPLPLLLWVDQMKYNSLDIA